MCGRNALRTSGRSKATRTHGGVIGPVIGDVGEVKAIHRMPEVRRERASHAPKLAGRIDCERRAIARPPCVRSAGSRAFFLCVATTNQADHDARDARAITN